MRHGMWCCWLVVLVLGAPASSEDALDKVAVDQDGNVTRIVPIGALTHARRQFAEASLGRQYAPPDAVADRGHSPFERADPVYQYGSADEVIERIKVAVSPWFWEETEGASIVAMGEGALVIRASPAIHKEVWEHLLLLDHEPTVAVELLALPATAAQLAAWTRSLDDEARAALDTHEGAVGARLHTVSGHPATLTRGTHEAFVFGVPGEPGHHAIEPAHVGIGRTGFVATVEAVLGPKPQIDLHLDASLVGDAKEAGRPGHEPHVRWQAHMRATRHWQYVGAAGTDEWAWGLFARARVEVPPEPRGFAAEFLPPPPRLDEEIAPVHRRYRIQHLIRHRAEPRAPFGDLREPTFRWEPEDAEPAAPWDPDALVEIIQAVTGEMAWEQGMIQSMGGELLASAQPRVHACIEKILAHATQRAREHLVLDLRIYDTTAQVSSASALEEAATKGGATVVGFARLRCAPGQHNGLRSGTWRRFVSSHEIERDGERLVATPVVGEFLDGLAVAVRPYLSVGRRQVLCDVRISQQRLHDVQRPETKVGRIELPAVRVFRTQATLRATLGQSLIVGRADRAGRSRVVTLTATFEP